MILTYVRKTHISYSQYFHYSHIRLQFIFLTSKQERGPIKQIFAIYCSHIFMTLSHTFLYKIWRGRALRPFCCKSSLKSPEDLLILIIVNLSSENKELKLLCSRLLEWELCDTSACCWSAPSARAFSLRFTSQCSSLTTLIEMNFRQFCDRKGTCRTLLISNY